MWTFLKTQEELDSFTGGFLWHDGWVKSIHFFYPAHKDGEGIAGYECPPSMSVIVGDGDGGAWEFLFLEVVHSTFCGTYLDSPVRAVTNTLCNEINWEWGDGCIKARKVCFRRLPAEVLEYSGDYRRRNLYARSGLIDLEGDSAGGE